MRSVAEGFAHWLSVGPGAEWAVELMSRDGTIGAAGMAGSREVTPEGSPGQASEGQDCKFGPYALDVD